MIPEHIGGLQGCGPAWSSAVLIPGRCRRYACRCMPGSMRAANSGGFLLSPSVLTARSRPATAGALPLLTVAALVATALVPLGLSWFGPQRFWVLLVLASVVIGLGLVGFAVTRAGYGSRQALRVRRAVLRPTVEMALHLSPVVLL